jgi:hypothetical protein
MTLTKTPKYLSAFSFLFQKPRSPHVHRTPAKPDKHLVAFTDSKFKNFLLQLQVVTWKCPVPSTYSVLSAHRSFHFPRLLLLRLIRPSPSKKLESISLIQPKPKRLPTSPVPLQLLDLTHQNLHHHHYSCASRPSPQATTSHTSWFGKTPRL